MSKNEVPNKMVYEKLEEIRKLMKTQLGLFKLANNKVIEDARKDILKEPVRKRIRDLCDDKNTVTQIAQAAFPGEPVAKSQPKTSYHLAILEEYDMIDDRDEKGQRYYFKKRE
jgi:DNA-binding transcriptional ArsR family regulator